MGYGGTILIPRSPHGDQGVNYFNNFSSPNEEAGADCRVKSVHVFGERTSTTDKILLLIRFRIVLASAYEMNADTYQRSTDKMLVTDSSPSGELTIANGSHDHFPIAE
jgi:hypothetical protein